MSSIIAFLLGFFFGGIFGMLTTALIVAARGEEGEGP